MSTRNSILEDFKTCLKHLTDVKDVVRKFVFYDQINSFPYLMVLGGDETLEDTLGGYTVSRMTVRVLGYSKNSVDPEKEQCKLIDDVLTCLDNDTYNTRKEMMRPISIETDEGQLHPNGDGLALFVLTLEITYKFDRSNP